jgi:hypothetical protein
MIQKLKPFWFCFILAAMLVSFFAPGWIYVAGMFSILLIVFNGGMILSNKMGRSLMDGTWRKDGLLAGYRDLVSAMPRRATRVPFAMIVVFNVLLLAATVGGAAFFAFIFLSPTLLDLGPAVLPVEIPPPYYLPIMPMEYAIRAVFFGLFTLLLTIGVILSILRIRDYEKAFQAAINEARTADAEGVPEGVSVEQTGVFHTLKRFWICFMLGGIATAVFGPNLMPLVSTFPLVLMVFIAVWLFLNRPEKGQSIRTASQSTPEINIWTHRFSNISFFIFAAVISFLGILSVLFIGIFGSVPQPPEQLPPFLPLWENNIPPVIFIGTFSVLYVIGIVLALCLYREYSKRIINKGK